MDELLRKLNQIESEHAFAVRWGISIERDCYRRLVEYDMPWLLAELRSRATPPDPPMTVHEGE